jgi:hypothetical protein
MVDRWNRIYSGSVFVTWEVIEDTLNNPSPPVYYPGCFRQIFDGIMHSQRRFTDLGCEYPPNQFMFFLQTRVILPSNCWKSGVT